MQPKALSRCGAALNSSSKTTSRIQGAEPQTGIQLRHKRSPGRQPEVRSSFINWESHFQKRKEFPGSKYQAGRNAAKRFPGRPESAELYENSPTW